MVIFSENFEQQVERLQDVFCRIQKANLKLKPTKCHLFKAEVAFLGHILSSNGVAPNKENIQKIVEWEPPKSSKQVQSFLGMANYYRRFVPGFSNIVRPMVDLTKKGVKFEWTKSCQEAFDSVRQKLISTPILAHPRHEGMYILDTDASDIAIGAILSQIQDQEEKVIAYGSKSLSKTQRNYCVTDRELLAVRYFTEFYRIYLLGKKFVVRTDHQAIKWLFSLKNPRNRIARWLESFAEYDFEVEHRAGVKHLNADGMSRCPNPWNCQCKNMENLKCGPCKKCLRKTELMSGELINEDEDGGLVQEIKQIKIQPTLGACLIKFRDILLEEILLVYTILMVVGGGVKRKVGCWKTWFQLQNLMVRKEF